jgi:ribonuclease HII
VEVVALSAAEVDARGERGLNSLEAQTFGKLIGSVRPGRAYVDAADVDAGRFRDAVGAVAGAGIELVSEHKADAKYPLVSAASIVAKVRRDAEVRAIAAGLEERLGPGPLSRVGSGYPGDRRTRDCILTWIKERGIPPPHTRLSWDTVRRLTAEAKVRQLSEW